MKKFTALMPSWKGSELLKYSIPSILDSFTEDSKLVVILNEADKESIDICLGYGIEFICLPENRGTLVIDYASHLIDAEYVANVNSDMFFIKGWDKEMINIIEEYYPCTASCFLVEPGDTGNPIVIADNIGPFNNETRLKFEKNWAAGKYIMPKKKISFTHPIVTKTEDYYAVGGYSNNFDLDWAPGYGLDDFYPWRLWNRSSGKYRFIASEKYAVFHGISLTNNKLAPNIKARNGLEKFFKETGITNTQFKHWINCFSEID